MTGKRQTELAALTGNRGPEEDVPQEVPNAFFRFCRTDNGTAPFLPEPADQSVPETGAASSAAFTRYAWRRLRKNKAAVFSLCLLAFIMLIAFFAPLIAPHPPNEQHIPYANLPPRISGLRVRGFNGELRFRGSWVNRYKEAGIPDDVFFIFGTDEFGRDLFSRTLYGTRISLVIAFIAAFLDLSIGILYGLSSAMRGGRTDTILQRFLEILSGVPSLVLVVLLLLVFRPGIISIVFALAISSWIPMARLVRAQTLRVKELEYVLAARSLGAGTASIAFFHVLPNIAGTIVVRTMFSIPAAIFFETFLSFIGVGMKIPNASLGTLLGGGYKVFRIYPYQLWFPAIILCVIMLAFNLFADGLRDVLDPRQKENYDAP
jgi:oligopeptide transport system permease protein